MEEGSSGINLSNSNEVIKRGLKILESMFAYRLDLEQPMLATGYLLKLVSQVVQLACDGCTSP